MSAPDFSDAVLVLLGDQLNNSYQSVQLEKGIFAPNSISVSDLFAAAIVPGLTLVTLYILFLVAVAFLRPAAMPPIAPDPNAPKGFALATQLGKALLAPVLLIAVVLGSILIGLATPTEAAAVGAVGAILLAASGKLVEQRRRQSYCARKHVTTKKSLG